VRVSEGVKFADGTTLDASAGKLTLRDASGADVVGPTTAGTGTQNRVAKWMETGGVGTLGDTQITENNGSVVVGNAGQTGNIQIFGGAGQDVFAGMGPDINAGPAFNYGYAGGSFGRSAGFFNVRPDASAIAPNPSLRFMTTNVERMIVTNTGNIGIGTTNPTTKLDVAGSINTSAQYSFGGNRILGANETSNLYVGRGTGTSTASGNTFVGNGTGLSTTTGGNNTFVGENAGAGQSNQAGSGNVSVGYGAGATNTVATSNVTLIGAGTSAIPLNFAFSIQNATAIGAGAVANQDNSISIGRTNHADVVFLWGPTYAYGGLNVSAGNLNVVAEVSAASVSADSVNARNNAPSSGTTAQIGERYRDNGIVAWGTIAAAGTITQSFGVSAVTKDATGVYTITVAASATTTANNLVPVANAEVADPPTSAATSRLVTINQVTLTQFKVYITNGAFAAVDNKFTFIVTGR
jgi:hypothetical protein